MNQYIRTYATMYIGSQIEMLTKSGTLQSLSSEREFLNGSKMAEIKAGRTRISLDQIPLIASALHIEVGFLARLVLRDHWPELKETLERCGLLAEERSFDEDEVSESDTPVAADDGLGTVKDFVVRDDALTPNDEGYRSFVDLNFKVAPLFHKRFRVEAGARAIPMKELLERSFSAYLDANGGTMRRPREDLLQGDKPRRV